MTAYPDDPLDLRILHALARRFPDRRSSSTAHLHLPPWYQLVWLGLYLLARYGIMLLESAQGFVFTYEIEN